MRQLFDPIPPIDINAGTMLTADGQEPFFQYHPFAAFSWIPNARFLRQTVNSQGFVSTREVAFAKAKGELRIVTLGESSTVGNGNLDEQTYPRILERILQERFPDRRISVINAAAGGYTTRESLGYLQSRLVFWRPDIVLVMHGWNDMYYFTKTDEELSAWRKDFNLQANWNPDVALTLKDSMPMDLQYLSWSQAYLHLRGYVRRHRGPGGANTVEVRHEGVKVGPDGRRTLVTKPVNPSGLLTYRRNLEQIRDLCDREGITAYGIMQPTLLLVREGAVSEQIKRAFETAVAYHAFGPREHLEAFSSIYRVNREVFGEGSVIDATAMNGREDLFLDHIHQNSAGTEALARIVGRRVAGDIPD